MKIKVCKGTGTGPTELAAFDQALVNAGIANHNLIYLSSVIPPGSEIKKVGQITEPLGLWGDRLYIVIAQMRTTQRNQGVWAGIGWMQDPKTKHGLLVEHEGHNESEVRADIENTLHALAENRKMKFGSIHMEVVGTTCEEKPVCALVVAVFESQNWESNTANDGPHILRRLAKSARKSR